MRAFLTCGVLALLACGSSTPKSDPGRVTLHRLNNAEYNNTVRDLLGTTLRPADNFDADGRAYGFDTVADALLVSTLGMELYEQAARDLIDQALAVATPVGTQDFEIVGSTNSGGPRDGGWFFFSNGTAAVDFTAPAEGRYRISVRAYQQQAGAEDAQLSIEVAGLEAQLVTVSALEAAPAVYSVDVTMNAGAQQVVVGFVNDAYDQATMADRNLWVDYVRVEGPYDGPIVDEGPRAAILVCSALADAACQRDIVARFTKRAWRRPPTDAELARLLEVVGTAMTHGDTPEAGIRLALQSVLISPHFIYRVEVDPDPGSLAPHPLTSWELASRLSYFLWSTMPDDELFAAAESNTLLEPAELDRQVRRMLDDPKAVALIDNFAGQWLFLRALGSQDPDYTLFPEYDDELEEAFRQETRLFFQALITEDRSMSELLTADYTFVNDRLAAFYGLPPVGTNDFVRVSLADTPRRGFLMQGSFLRVTSRPKRTSPVLRGKWVLDNLLCAPPPAPPPGVEGSFPPAMEGGSVRDRFEQHVKDPVCASCHNVMDPIGFGLDNFDAIGRYRTEEAGLPIDASGSLFDDLQFTNARELVETLAAQPAVYRCMVEKLYTYSGRPPFRLDAIEHVEELTKQFEANNYSLRELIVSMATHPSFTSRRGER